MPSRHSIAASLILAAVVLASCTKTPTITPINTDIPAPTAEAATPTPEPPQTLTVCLGQEPSTLYLYGGASRAQWSVLEAVYDGPVDRRGYVDQPVILAQIPSRTNGANLTTPVAVTRGQMVQTADGTLAPLDTGTVVLPAGCSNESCAVTWDGTSPLEMDQQRLTFTLLPGLKWSDGTPLTAADSVYSYQVAADPATPVNPLVVERTESYTAADDTTVIWTGIPGYQTHEPAAYFFIPLPRHVYSQLSAAELLKADLSTRKPLGWGPYIIESWTPGSTIELTRNPNYFRASEGLPAFDHLTFKFLGAHADNNLVALVEGQCDVVGDTTLLEEQLSSVRVTELNGRIKTYISLGPEWEHLDFGIVPAAYDGGVNPISTGRPDFFGDLRVRQAFAACIDRQALVSELLYSQSQVPQGFFPPDNPLYAADLPQIPYDPARGAQLLTEAGWLDQDNDPTTPRTASSVARVSDSTPFEVTYLTTTEPLRMATGDRIAKMMRDCGVEVKVKTEDAGVLFAAGPQGPLFGRNFDLAQFAWQSGSGSPCFLDTTAQIPTAANDWLGINITGWSNAAYDTACKAAMNADSENPEDYAAANRVVQEQFASELPVLPLYYSIHLSAARPDVCGIQVDSSARSEFWNLESLSKGDSCP